MGVSMPNSGAVSTYQSYCIHKIVEVLKPVMMTAEKNHVYFLMKYLEIINKQFSVKPTGLSLYGEGGSSQTFSKVYC